MCFISLVQNFTISLFLQLVVGLLFLTAISRLGVTLGEDFGPGDPVVDVTRNATVFYVNPVLFAVSWVN